MKTLLHILLLFLSVALTCCKKPGCFETAGAVTINERNAASFHRMEIMDKIDVAITQDTAEWIKVEAGTEVQPNIITAISDGILTIKNATTCKWLRNPAEKITVHVGVKKLDYVNYNGSGDVRSTNTIVADDITFYSREGAGNIEVTLDAKNTTATVLYENADFIFRGKTDACYVYVNSRGSIDFENFEARYMSIGYASVRNATIHVTETLESLVYHTGNLYYKGTPSYVSTHSYSSGKIIPVQ